MPLHGGTDSRFACLVGRGVASLASSSTEAQFQTRLAAIRQPYDSNLSQTNLGYEPQNAPSQGWLTNCM